MPQTGGNDPKRESSDEVRDAADQVIGEVIGRVPEGSPLKQRLKEAGVVGLVLGVLMGNIPISAVVGPILSGKGTLNADALETYWEVFKLVTPWVAVFAFVGFCIYSGQAPQLPMAGYAALTAGLVFAAGALSFALGGQVPPEVQEGPTNGPSAWGAYVGDSLSAYIELYGPWPPLAGAVEGMLFGWWASLLAED